MKNVNAEPKREIVLTCRIGGVEVSLEALAQEINRCGGIVRKGGRKDGR